MRARTMAELLAAIESAIADDAIRVIVLTGAQPGVFIRHYRVEEILRTGFVQLPGSSVGVQVIAESGTCDLVQHDLSREGEDLVGRVLTDLLAKPFDLDREDPGTSLRAALVTRPDGNHDLILVQPALCADASSLWNLVACVAQRLDAFFAKYVSINSFTETVVRTVDHGEVMRWPARIGRRHTL